jgi:hypothetical protein
VEIHHVDGHEENGEPENLLWLCRACNVSAGIVMAQAGIGRRTRQFNPMKKQGAQTLAQWVTAVLAMKGQNDAMSPAAAIELIHATPADARSRFAHQIWQLRRKHGTARWTSAIF